MVLPFLDRLDERRRLERSFAAASGTLCCLYGRRRCGKSRLLLEVLPAGLSAYYIGDDRSGELQREDLARAIDAVVPGFGDLRYPSWQVLLDQWYQRAPDGAVLALDEFTAIVGVSPGLPSLLQKFVDRCAGRSRPPSRQTSPGKEEPTSASPSTSNGSSARSASRSGHSSTACPIAVPSFRWTLRTTCWDCSRRYVRR